MKIVPIEPTAAMIAAYRSAIRDYINRLPAELRKKRKTYPKGYIVPEADKAAIRWRAMVNAAPNDLVGESNNLLSPWYTAYLEREVALVSNGDR